MHNVKHLCTIHRRSLMTRCGVCLAVLCWSSSDSILDGPGSWSCSIHSSLVSRAFYVTLHCCRVTAKYIAFHYVHVRHMCDWVCGTFDFRHHAQFMYNLWDWCSQECSHIVMTFLMILISWEDSSPKWDIICQVGDRSFT